jgi:sulfopyruvate decarboxylase TPP-binding subunit
MSVAIATRQLSFPVVVPQPRRRNVFDDIDETPREARIRVARELEQGLRCRGRMLSGGPCSLLLPCASHP